jgi:hypothetical protein
VSTSTTAQAIAQAAATAIASAFAAASNGNTAVAQVQNARAAVTVKLLTYSPGSAAMSVAREAFCRRAPWIVHVPSSNTLSFA